MIMGDSSPHKKGRPVNWRKKGGDVRTESTGSRWRLSVGTRREKAITAVGKERRTEDGHFSRGAAQTDLASEEEKHRLSGA